MSCLKFLIRHPSNIFEMVLDSLIEPFKNDEKVVKETFRNYDKKRNSFPVFPSPAPGGSERGGKKKVALIVGGRLIWKR